MLLFVFIFKKKAAKSYFEVLRKKGGRKHGDRRPKFKFCFSDSYEIVSR